MLPMQSNIRLGLIGPSSAGKTSLFQTFHEALDRHRHGFSRAADPQIRHEAEPTPVEGLSRAARIKRFVGRADRAVERETAIALGANLPGTPPDQVVTRHFSLSYTKRREPRITIPLTITDAAGEHSFGKGLQNSEFEDYRDRLYQELGDCNGFVVVVPFSDATDANFIRQLEDWLTALDPGPDPQDKKDREKEKRKDSDSPSLRRVVIALTRYDALFTDFGSEALNLAADPAIATAIINRLVRDATNGTGFRNNIARFDAPAKGRFEIAFMPTSSFGFVPGFGCVNLDPDAPDASSKIRSGASPDPYRAIPTYPEQRLFPFLTADPFIYAATGLENDFAVPLDSALRQESYANRKASSQRKRGGPETSKGPVIGPKRNAEPEQKESLSRRIKGAFGKWDVEL